MMGVDGTVVVVPVLLFLIIVAAAAAAATAAAAADALAALPAADPPPPRTGVTGDMATPLSTVRPTPAVDDGGSKAKTLELNALVNAAALAAIPSTAAAATLTAPPPPARSSPQERDTGSVGAAVSADAYSGTCSSRTSRSDLSLAKGCDSDPKPSAPLVVVADDSSLVAVAAANRCRLAAVSPSSPSPAATAAAEAAAHAARPPPPPPRPPPPLSAPRRRPSGMTVRAGRPIALLLVGRHSDASSRAPPRHRRHLRRGAVVGAPIKAVRIRPFDEYPVRKHLFGCESGRTRTHAIYQMNPTQTHWHDRLTLIPIPEKK